MASELTVRFAQAADMILSYASNAVLSKARALYGKRISDRNYTELLACNEVADIASYLKRRTNYKDVLSGINENSVHRVDLEECLKLKLFADFESLGRYDLWVGEHFYEYIISRAEIEQIMHSLMLLSAGKSGEYIRSIPGFFYSHSKFDIKALEHIESYDEFLKIISKTPYYKILLPFKPSGNQEINLTFAETALYNYLYDIVFGIINKYVRGKAKKQLIDFFNLYIDLSNLVRIVRMKKFYNLSEDYMMSGLMKYGTLSADELRKFVVCESNKQMMTDMKNTKMGKKWFSRGLDVVDKVPINMRYNWCRHNIRFSVSPPIVLISYIFLQEVEILNLTNIIEGVKYKLPPEEIRKMLIV